MIRYRNVLHGRVVERHVPDEWLEASSGWERVEERLVDVTAYGDTEPVFITVPGAEDDNERQDEDVRS